MPDHRRHRGADPRDAGLFGDAALPALRTAVGELSWLLDRGYAEASAVKLVGDRHRLNERQRMAVRRSSCGDSARADRLGRRASAMALSGRELALDGFNVLTTVEAALGGAVLLCGRDGSVRDLAGVHGTYRKVEETRPALALIGQVLARLGTTSATWYLDRPVSNSGRLRVLIDELAAQLDQRWQVEVVFSPDAALAAETRIVATADAGILDRCAAWFPLAGHVVALEVPGAWVIDLEST